jgi:replicative DNA helicase
VDDVAQTSFSPGKLVGIAALPKMGKSRLAAAIAGHMVSEHGFTGSVWYTDGAGWHWPRDQIARRAGISTSKLDNPRMMGEHDWARVTAQVQEVKEWPVHIHARGRPHIRDIMLSTKQRLAEHPDRVHVLVVDYVQNVTAGIRGDKRANVDAAIDGLRELRTDHPNLLILALMQFNRGASQKSIPSWTDLKESSTLEQALDSLFIFHRPAMLDDNASAEDKKKGILWLALTKFDEPKRKALRCDLARLKFDAYSGRDF